MSQKCLFNQTGVVKTYYDVPDKSDPDTLSGGIFSVDIYSAPRHHHHDHHHHCHRHHHHHHRHRNVTVLFVMMMIIIVVIVIFIFTMEKRSLVADDPSRSLLAMSGLASTLWRRCNNVTIVNIMINNMIFIIIIIMNMNINRTMRQ